MGKIIRGNQDGGDKGIEFETCPPERKRGNFTVLACGCCCCCCCLHSAGSVIGAVAGSVLKRSRSSFYAVAVYWCVFPIVVGLYVWACFYIRGNSGKPACWFAVVLCLPGAQLVASALAAAFVASSPNRKHHLMTIGRITLGTIIGGLVGFGIMILGYWCIELYFSR